ncbi:MAG: prolipoprotein diacylglyceryl transferase [Bacteroidales bacterium]|nr:prolipoprotein diacylglyceryl transferase [Bacteroidales bacterium]
MMNLLQIHWNFNPELLSFSVNPILMKVLAVCVVIGFLAAYVRMLVKEENKSLSDALVDWGSLIAYVFIGFIIIKLNVDEIVIRWYSLLFISGFILGWFIFRGFFRREGVPETLLDPLLYTLLIGTIVGARLGHCLFYQPDYYLGSWQGFWEIFMPWKGGLASHGGTIALFIAMWWFARHYGRKYDFDFVWILDHLAIAVCFAATFIRLGNLFNSEIYGDVTNLPWGFVFELRGETEPKHPTQLYEALSYFLLGVFQILMYKYRLPKLHRGFFIGTFFIGCFGSRFLIEFIKEVQVGFENDMVLNMGQWLSIPFILLGIGFLVYARVKKVPAMIVHPEKKKAAPTNYAKSLSK